MTQQQKIDEILESAGLNIEKGVGGLLGCDLTLSTPVNRLISKEDFLPTISQKMVLARMTVKDNTGENVYLLVTLKAAIFLAGTLVMLPHAQLEKRTINEEFGEDDEDAFGEIANITAGVYSAAFAEHHSEKLHFQMTGLEKIDPLQKSMESLLSSRHYYLSATTMRLDNQKLDELWMLFPAQLLKLDKISQPAVREGRPGDPLLILITTAAEVDTGPFTKALQEHGTPFQVVNIKDNLKDVLPAEGILGALLTMGKVDEQSLGAIIKVRSACGEKAPLIAAGSEWTRNKVIKAVECGVNDIILTPATAEVIKQRIDSLVN